MLKFPRTELTAPELAAVEAYLAADVRPLFEGSTALVSHLRFDSIVMESLRVTARSGRLSQGLEAIEDILAAEKKGLAEVQARLAQPAGQRMSRLLLLSNDGSARFYRQVSNLLSQHSDRLWACRLEATAAELGALITVRGNPAKAVLIEDKKVVALFLTELSRRVVR